jgi:hypothetical protein
MLNLGRDEASDPKTAYKPVLGSARAGNTGDAHARSSSLPPIPTLTSPVTPETPPKNSSAPAPDIADAAGSKLSVGPNIKLKGVEISNCDILIVEGHMEATVSSTAMKISQPGTLKGIAVIDIAEIHGEFSGELTARKKLVVHGTGASIIYPHVQLGRIVGPRSCLRVGDRDANEIGGQEGARIAAGRYRRPFGRNHVHMS